MEMDTASQDLQPPQADVEIGEEVHQSAAIIALSLILGMVANLIFYDFPLGMNVPFFVIVCLAIAGGLLWAFEKRIHAPNAALGAVAIVFALFFVWRSSEMLLFFNFMAVAGLVFVGLRFAAVPRFIGGHYLLPIAEAFQHSVAGWFIEPMTVAVNGSQWLTRFEAHRQNPVVGGILRGTLLALPILIVFGVLLGSADAVLGDLFSDFFDAIIPDNIDELVGRLILLGFVAWMIAGLYKLMLQGRLAEAALNSLAEDLQGRLKAPFKLGIIESGMVLGSVNLLFALFVGIQAQYFFGGEDNINLDGYTYAEYARRGFFELLVVSVMTMGLLVALHVATRRESDLQKNVFRGLAALMIAMTGVMLVSALRRLGLYEDAFGFTQIRVMSRVFMIWLALLFVILLADMLRGRLQWFPLGSAAVALAFIVTLNAMNMDGYIAAHNIERWETTDDLDVDYLIRDLSDDAIPQIAPLLDRLDEFEQLERNGLEIGLGGRLWELDQHRDNRGVWGYNHAKQAAWQALDPYRELLGENVKFNRYTYY